MVADGIAQQIPRAHGGQLWETFHEPLGLGTFADARRTDEDDAGGAFELFGGHSRAGCKYASGEVDWLLEAPIRGLGGLLFGSLEARSFEDFYTTASWCEL